MIFYMSLPAGDKLFQSDYSGPISWLLGLDMIFKWTYFSSDMLELEEDRSWVPFNVFSISQSDGSKSNKKSKDYVFLHTLLYVEYGK